MTYCPLVKNQTEKEMLTFKFTFPFYKKLQTISYRRYFYITIFWLI